MSRSQMKPCQAMLWMLRKDADEVGKSNEHKL